MSDNCYNYVIKIIINNIFSTFISLITSQLYNTGYIGHCIRIQLSYLMSNELLLVIIDIANKKFNITRYENISIICMMFIMSIFSPVNIPVLQFLFFIVFNVINPYLYDTKIIPYIACNYFCFSFLKYSMANQQGILWNTYANSSVVYMLADMTEITELMLFSEERKISPNKKNYKAI